MRNILSLILIGFLSIQNAVAQDKTTEISNQLKKTLPEISIDSIQTTPLPGIYQLNSGPNVIYVSEDGRFIISGDIIDVNNERQNITEIARKKVRASSLAAARKDAISFAPANPKHRIVVFTDIDCGYCRKLHNDVAKLNEMGIAVDYLAFPRGGPSSPTFDKMVTVWCSPDKQAALSDAKAGKPLKEQICVNHHIDEQFKFGLMMGISGTPTIILEDGTMLPGYLPPDKIKALLQQVG